MPLLCKLSIRRNISIAEGVIVCEQIEKGPKTLLKYLTQIIGNRVKKKGYIFTKKELRI